MRENTLGAGVHFAAKNFVTVNSEPVKKILLLLTFSTTPAAVLSLERY